ncbi:killer toxin [Karstenula rhodostoma CBS 690.94]|uniref:Killer toxin n=1 Tax=Karstenula rhodostoma CBS 690.94 TaxID=1392251 RepID=A0A9P4PPJ3_9PLEO|nr:killer toxin [Karstenula rhodostoma CBS 690.94]
MKLLIVLAFLFALSTQLGINCRGSFWAPICGRTINNENGPGGMYDFINENLSDAATFQDGQQIACMSCHAGKNEGLCVFTQNFGDQIVDGKQVKEAVLRLLKHGCVYHGSAPINPGNNVKDGQITVNYVTNGCVKHGAKIC